MKWQHAVNLKSICVTNSIIIFSRLKDRTPHSSFNLLSSSVLLPFTWTNYLKSKIFFPLCVLRQSILSPVFFLNILLPLESCIEYSCIAYFCIAHSCIAYSYQWSVNSVNYNQLRYCRVWITLSIFGSEARVDLEQHNSREAPRRRYTWRNIDQVSPLLLQW